MWKTTLSISVVFDVDLSTKQVRRSYSICDIYSKRLWEDIEDRCSLLRPDVIPFGTGVWVSLFSVCWDIWASLKKSPLTSSQKWWRQRRQWTVCPQNFACVDDIRYAIQAGTFAEFEYTPATDLLTSSNTVSNGVWGEQAGVSCDLDRQTWSLLNRFQTGQGFKAYFLQTHTGKSWQINRLRMRPT